MDLKLGLVSELGNVTSGGGSPHQELHIVPARQPYAAGMFPTSLSCPEPAGITGITPQTSRVGEPEDSPVSRRG